MSGPGSTTRKRRVDFARINTAALARLPALLARWLPDGRELLSARGDKTGAAA